MRKEQDKLSWLESQMDELFGKNREPRRATGSCSALNFLGDISKSNAHYLCVEGATNPRFFFYPAERGQTNDSETLRTLIVFHRRFWRFCFLTTCALGGPGPVHARPCSLADTSLGENGNHKTGHDAMGPPPCFQDGRRTTRVQDGRRTTSITRNICQSGQSIFQN